MADASDRIARTTALARALAGFERAPRAPATIQALDDAFRRGRGRILGVTGPPGVGKSSLIGALGTLLRARGDSLAILAIDPSSRRSGGALLGDRARFEFGADDPHVFTRSLAAGERLGGLAPSAHAATIYLRSEFDWVVVETVGVGQSEVEIVDLAERVLLAAQPQAGDYLQLMKAGVVETPDLVAVTKADLGPAAERARRDFVAWLQDRGGEKVFAVSSATGEGLDALLDAVTSPDPDAAAAWPRKARVWLERAIQEEHGRAGLRRWRSSPDAPALAAAAAAAPFAAIDRALAILENSRPN